MRDGKEKILKGINICVYETVSYDFFSDIKTPFVSKEHLLREPFNGNF